MQHVFPHQNPYQPDWQHHAHAPSHHAYAQTQAAAAANAAAQQQHYGRMTQNQNGNAANDRNDRNGTMLAGSHGQGLGGQALGGGRDVEHGGMMVSGENVSEENRKVLEWIAQVLSASSREAALLELSKKREQVPELALILWHSFGEYRS